MNVPTFKTGALAATVLAVASIAGAQQSATQDAGQQRFDQALRELNIMSNIFSATLREDAGDNRRDRFTATPRSLYLAGQGMVFTFDVNNPWFGGGLSAYWRQFSMDMSRFASEIAAEVTANFPDVDFDFDYDFDFQDPALPAPAPPAPPSSPRVFAGPGTFAVDSSDWLEAQREQQEVAREMAEAMRDRQRDIQELQRDLRELQRDLRDPDEDAARLESELAEVEAEIESERAALENQRAAYQQYMTEYEARRVEQLAAYSREVARRAVSALCDYGATLRSLPPEEHVTLIFENFLQDRDQVYVFEYADIASCSSADDLMAGAVSYQI